MTHAGQDQRRRLQELLSGLWRQVATPDESAQMLTTTLELVTPEGRLRLGRDREGLPHLLVPVGRSDVGEPLRGTEGLSLDVRDLLVEDLPVRFLDLACLRADLSHVFAGLAVDVCLRLLSRPGEPVDSVTTVIDEWRALLERRPSTWTPSRCAGLFAELVVLRRLTAMDAGALTTWAGPFGAAQDFRVPHRAIEVKATVGAEGRIVRVHGSDQLEAPAGGELHLAWFRLGETPGDNGGATLRTLLDQIGAAVADVKLWAECLSRLGVPAAPQQGFEDRRFSVLEERWYQVGPTFPKVVPAAFADGAVPAGVGGIDYLLDLDVVPVTHQIQDVEGVLAEVVGVR